MANEKARALIEAWASDLRITTCRTCGGTGRAAVLEVWCPHCNGRGETIELPPNNENEETVHA